MNSFATNALKCTSRKFAVVLASLLLIAVCGAHAQVPNIKANTYMQCASFMNGKRTESDVRSSKVFISTMPNGQLCFSLEPGSATQVNLFLNYAGSNNGWYIFTDYLQLGFMGDPSMYATWVYVNRNASRVRVSDSVVRMMGGKDDYLEYRIWTAKEDVILGPTK